MLRQVDEDYAWLLAHRMRLRTLRAHEKVSGFLLDGRALVAYVSFRSATSLHIRERVAGDSRRTAAGWESIGVWGTIHLPE